LSILTAIPAPGYHDLRHSPVLSRRQWQFASLCYRFATSGRFGLDRPGTGAIRWRAENRGQPAMHDTRRVALLLDKSLGFVREVLQGIRIYAAGRAEWVLRDAPPRARVVAQLCQWKPHGVIGSLVLRRVAEALIRMRIPVVDTAYVLPELRLPTVDVDHTAVGRLAADYFLERRFRQFGFFGSASVAYSRIQEAAFCAKFTQVRLPVSSCYAEVLPDLADAAQWKKSVERVRRWLGRLPKPAAILCCEDAAARYLADVCDQSGVGVPDQVSLLGVGNDPLECNLTWPSLSSIGVPAERIGYRAAAVLDSLMSGGPPPPRPVLLPPLHVVTRRSTDVLAVEDEVLQAALVYLRQHVRESLTVAQVARDLAVSRRLLERRFRDVLGRSVLEQIHRMRVERAKELLADTSLPIDSVAVQAGFSGVRRLDVVFAKTAGMSPTAYRRQARAR
jgi:LacI family transcriptional regulator